MTRDERLQRIAHLQRQAQAMRREMGAGFADLLHDDGHIIATAKERTDCCWRLIIDCERQAERLQAGVRRVKHV